MPRPKPVVTLAQKETFERMYLAGADKQEIAEALGIYTDRAKKMIMEMPPNLKRIRKFNQAKRTRGLIHHVRRDRDPSEQAWADRERRLAAPRTLTAEFCGDPRPGQSALDKRSASA